MWEFVYNLITYSIYLGSPEIATAAGIGFSALLGKGGTNPSDCLNLGNSYSITYWQTDPGSSDLARLDGSVLDGLLGLVC